MFKTTRFSPIDILPWVRGRGAYLQVTHLVWIPTAHLFLFLL